MLAALEPIELRWGSELAELDLAVDDVPEVDETSPDEVVWAQGVLADIGVPLAQLVPAGVDPDGMPSRARIVLYRRPLEARARSSDEDLAELLHEVLVEQVAEYLNIEPDAVDGPRRLSPAAGIGWVTPDRVTGWTGGSDSAAQPAPLTLRQPAPDAEPLVVRQRVLQALGTHLAARADALGLPGGAALLREERLRIGLGAQRPLLPVRFLVVVRRRRTPRHDPDRVDEPQRRGRRRVDRFRQATAHVDQLQRGCNHVHSPTSPHQPRPPRAGK